VGSLLGSPVKVPGVSSQYRKPKSYLRDIHCVCSPVKTVVDVVVRRNGDVHCESFKKFR
jgi:hypothetical protein